MSTQNNDKLNMIRLDLQSPRPASFLGTAFYKHLTDHNESINRDTWSLDDFLFPANEHILNPLNPVFLNHIYDLSAIEFVKYLMVRDGVYGVADFFHRFPSPENLTTTLIVPEPFANFVPTAWDQNVAYYYFRVDKENLEQGEDEILYIKGIGTSTSCSLDAVEELSKVIKSRGFKKIVAYLPMKEDFFCQKEDYEEQITHRIISLLLRNTSCEVEFLPWKDFLRCKTKGQFYDINGAGSIIYDDYIGHRLLGLGHRPLSYTMRESCEHDLFIRLSEYHGVNIKSKATEKNCKIAAEAQEMKKFLCPSGELYKSDYIYYLKEQLEGKQKPYKWYCSF